MHNKFMFYNNYHLHSYLGYKSPGQRQKWLNCNGCLTELSKKAWPGQLCNMHTAEIVKLLRDKVPQTVIADKYNASRGGLGKWIARRNIKELLVQTGWFWKKSNHGGHRWTCTGWIFLLGAPICAVVPDELAAKVEKRGQNLIHFLPNFPDLFIHILFSWNFPDLTYYDWINHIICNPKSPPVALIRSNNWWVSPSFSTWSVFDRPFDQFPGFVVVKSHIIS